jgi:Domain of unknown function (DUF5130)
VLAGSVPTPSQQSRLRRALQNADKSSGLTFSLYVGPSEPDTRRHAERLHASLVDPTQSVLVMCDPQRRALEIVTGAGARRRLDDMECGLAAASMQVSFAAGDLIGGLVHGLQQLGEAAYQPKTLHNNPPR